MLLGNRSLGATTECGSRTTSAIICVMRSRRAQITAALVLITCLVCPLVEMFDYWDHTVQTGNDTEYALVVLALCVGVAYTFARFVLKFPLLKLAAELVSNLRAHRSLLSGGRGFFFVVPIPLSPPTLPLRI